VVVPYFLAAGRHVIEDIPGEVATVREKYPEISIHTTPHLGASPHMSDAILHLTHNQ
jgi:sirohydrochlorin ferrochelatase